MAMLYLTHLPRSVLTCLFVLQDTLHFAVSSDMSKGVDEILARTQKKSEREKVQDARKEGLQQYYIETSSICEHDDPKLKDVVKAGASNYGPGSDL